MQYRLADEIFQILRKNPFRPAELLQSLDILVQVFFV